MAKVLDSPRRGRPKKETTMEALPLRISDELSKQIDEYHQRLQSQLPGLNISKADAVRQLITVGLKDESKPSWHLRRTTHQRLSAIPAPHPRGTPRFTRRDSYCWYVLLMPTSEAGIELARASLRVSG